nr:AMP-binding protein [Corallococcus coralloides]
MAKGYWRREDESARVFQARTAPGDGPYLRTGDLGFLDDGELYVTGREKDRIIVRGRNLYPQDLESVVEESYPALRPGCGVAFGAEVDGEEHLVVVQEVDARKWDGEVAPVLGAIRGRLATVHEVRPRAVVLIEPGSLPKTSSGKVQRRATSAGAPSPGTRASALGSAGGGPGRPYALTSKGRSRGRSRSRHRACQAPPSAARRQGPQAPGPQCPPPARRSPKTCPTVRQVSSARAASPLRFSRPGWQSDRTARCAAEGRAHGGLETCPTVGQVFSVRL